MSNKNTDIQSLLHKQAIQEVLMRFCRGIDRCDRDLLETVFWQDCVVDYGKMGGAALEFFATVLTSLEDIETHHQLGNVLIEIDGDSAQVESYITAYHYVSEIEKDMDMIAGGRYLDTFELRDDEWRIIKRMFVMDWNQNLPASARWHEGLHAQFTHRGKHYPDDMLYRQFNKKKSEST